MDHWRKMLSVLCTLCTFVVLAGCGGSDRPPPEEDSTYAALDEGLIDEQRIIESRRQSESCKPGTTRECHRYFKDATGHWQCPVDAQYCRPDGTGWAECGARPGTR
jgi:hypothetical protein